MVALLKKYFYPLLLVSLVLAICITAYVPGTFLTGWDTLHPELNFSLNFERMISGVWREEQGLGAVAGHSHMADLPRVAFLWLLHFVAPLSSLRYLYIFFCLLIGPLGMYTLLRYILSKSSMMQVTRYNTIAFLGALFYICNLGTVQQFYAPFEMFPTQYAYLPWIILFTLKYLAEHKFEKRNSQQLSNSKFEISNLKNTNLFLFSIATLFAAPQAYAAHLWYAFFGVYILFLFLVVVLNSFQNLRSDTGSRNKFGMTKGAVTILLLTLLVNSFWLLPNLYYITSSSSTPRESKQNRVFSQEYRIRNQENGYLPDVAIVRGFYMQWSVYNFQKGRFEYLMPEWRAQFDQPIVKTIGYLSFGIILLGILVAWMRKNTHLLSLIPFVALPFALLMNSTPPFSWLFNLLLRVPLFEEALRFVFTKLSILLVFGYAIFFAVGVAWIIERLRPMIVRYSVAFIIGLCLIYSCLPLFQGGLISRRFTQKIPDQYHALWSYMETQPNRPVLTLPLHTFSGWQYYSWGYQGSGFIWFGMPQPVLDRDSDRWSTANEEAFRELQYTLYSQRADDFAKMAQKYNVGYVLWDTSVTTPSEKNRSQILFERETQNVLNKLVREKKLYKNKTFGSLILYTIAPSHQTKIVTTTTQIQPAYRWSYLDQGYLDHGDYITAPQQYTGITSYPFRSFLKPTDRFIDDIAPSVPELKHPIRYSARRLSQDLPTSESITYQVDRSVIRFSTRNTSRGLSIENDGFPHTIGYVVGFTARNIKGLPLRFCLKNLYSNLCNTYDELSHTSDFVSDYFVIPPYQYGKGLGLFVDNISYGEYESINELKEVVLYPLYYDYLTKLSTSSGKKRTLTVLTNHQAFQPGWIALQCSQERFTCVFADHVLLNNWENGWLIPESSTLQATRYTIIFWPQILEYFGFALLTLTLILASKFGKMDHSS